MDFGMTNGKLELALRASNIGYVLQQWRVDCSSDHHIDDPAFRLWLLDNLVLYGINNAEHLAPAFDKKRSKPQPAYPTDCVCGVATHAVV